MHGSHIEDVETNQTFFHLTLAAHQLVRLKYPKELLRSDCTEYFESERSIGLLPASTGRPGKAMLNDHYCFYADQGINSGPSGYWLALESIDALPTRIVLTAAYPFHPASETFKEEYHLAKLYADFKGGWARWARWARWLQRAPTRPLPGWTSPTPALSCP